MGSLFVVGTPIGNLKDLSPRAVEVLKTCDLIAAEDTRYTLKLLNYFGIKTRRISYYKFNERERSQQIIQRILDEDINVALVSNAGTPCISDPGEEIVRLARENRIAVYGIPGPSAIITALSISGLPTGNFYFVGFLPKEAGAKNEVIQELKTKRITTFILYEAPQRIHKLAELLAQEFPHAKVCLCCDMTKKREKSYFGAIQEVIKMMAEDPGAEYGEYTVIVNTGYKAKVEKPFDICNEALLINEVIQRGCTVKEAVKLAAKEHGISKKELYEASLNLKSVLSDLIN
ncbi:MAG: 16S rRNA (cytidine(1402)-2'-O)-methyltransferase [Firmicutes bacterium]|nr:16S rRNA (cytidine(1402)-2'-O)-methyltransferase [Bacillota bacterium]